MLLTLNQIDLENVTKIFLCNDADENDDDYYCEDKNKSKKKSQYYNYNKNYLCFACFSRIC